MRRVIGTTMAELSLAAALHAQEPAATRRAATPPPAPPAQAPRSRVGYAASPQSAAPAQTIRPTYVMGGGSFLVLSDGSMLANFGNGYERVLRPCASRRGGSPSQQESTGRDALGRILPPPGIAALQAGTRGQMSGAAPDRTAQACYRSDARGRTEAMTVER